jgi:hypothetical protein
MGRSIHEEAVVIHLNRRSEAARRAYLQGYRAGMKASREKLVEVIARLEAIEAAVRPPDVNPYDLSDPNHPAQPTHQRRNPWRND